jgi:glycosyltransferase involved in cell wall biosynthesis
MLAENHQVFVVTNAMNRPFIEQSRDIKAQFFYVSDRYLRPLVYLGLPGEYLYYYFWQIKAYFLVRRLAQTSFFDISHHLTISTFKIPSFLSLIPVPFVWGPLGGGERIPRSIAQRIRLSCLERIRYYLHSLWLWVPGVRLTARRAASILVANDSTLDSLPRQYRQKCSVMSNLAVDIVPPNTAAERPGHERVTILYVGHLLAGKGLELLIRAAGQINTTVPWSILMVGDGKHRSYLQDLAGGLGLNDRIKFLGSVPHSEVSSCYQLADIFCFPSLRDSGGTVLLEAMASALPVVCLNLGGPAHIVDDSCGIRINPWDLDVTVDSLARALTNLVESSAMRLNLGAAARARIEKHFTWHAKSRDVLALYNGLVATSSSSTDKQRCSTEPSTPEVE